MQLKQPYLKTLTWYNFNQSNLSLVPRTSGVYFLGTNGSIIYIGSSMNLYERLTDHYHTSDPCIKRATEFAIEPCVNYKERERQQLLWYQSKHGRLPVCNDKI